MTDNKRTIRKAEPSTAFWSQLLVSWEAEVISMRLSHHLQSSYLLTPSDDDTPVSWQNNTANFLNNEGLIEIGLVHITHWHVWAAPRWSKQNSNTPLVYFCTIFFLTFNSKRKCWKDNGHPTFDACSRYWITLITSWAMLTACWYRWYPVCGR